MKLEKTIEYDKLDLGKRFLGSFYKVRINTQDSTFKGVIRKFTGYEPIFCDQLKPFFRLNRIRFRILRINCRIIKGKIQKATNFHKFLFISDLRKCKEKPRTKDIQRLLIFHSIIGVKNNTSSNIIYCKNGKGEKCLFSSEISIDPTQNYLSSKSIETFFGKDTPNTISRKIFYINSSNEFDEIQKFSEKLQQKIKKYCPHLTSWINKIESNFSSKIVKLKV